MSTSRLFWCCALLLITGCGSCKKKAPEGDPEPETPIAEAVEQHAADDPQHQDPVAPDPNAPTFDTDGGLKVTADLPERPAMVGAAPAIEPVKTLEARKPAFTIGSSTQAKGLTPPEPPGLYGPKQVSNTNFTRYCGGCHDADGSGQAMRKILPKLPDLSKTQPSDDRIKKLIREGHAEAPPLEKTLTSEEIDALLEEVKALKQ